MKAVSLFAGVGGFDLALERNGVDVVASVEIDKHARSVLQKQFPKSLILNDVMEVTGAQLIKAGFTPEDGVLVGGFPCQDVSVAGKRAGLTREDGSHTRSGLFWQVVRLLDETKAQNFILENVPGLLSSNGGRDFGTVIGALDDLGYGISWRILDAQYFGVPQRRRRVFIVGCLGDDGRTPSEILAISEGRERYLAQGAAKRQDVAGTLGGGSGSRGWSPDTDRMTFVPVAMDGYSQSTSETAQAIRASKSDGDHVGMVATFRKARRAQTETDDETWVPSPITNTLNSFDLGDTRTTEVLVHPVDDRENLSSAPLLFEDDRRTGPRIHDNTAPTLQSFMGTGGNNTPMVTYPIDDAREIEKHQNGTGIGGENAPAFTLDTRQAPAVAFSHTAGLDIQASEKVSPTIKAGHDTMPSVFDTVVRRLTPMECERLQGFPDGWTEGQTDAHRYKQMGNAVAVPVVEWIIKGLVNKLR